MSDVKKCAVCGKILPEGRTRYCSKECYDIYRREIQQYKRSFTYKITCEKCGNNFFSSRKRTHFCEVCKRDITDGKNAEKTCSVCGTNFTSNKVNAKYCCKECRRIGTNELSKISHRQHRMIYKEMKALESDLKDSASDGSRMKYGERFEEEVRACIASGQTYAERQIAKTMAMIPKIEVNV